MLKHLAFMGALLAPIVAFAQTPNITFNVVASALQVQLIASLSPTSCSITTGATGTCAQMVATMSPTSPAFSGTMTLAPTSGACPGTNDVSNFAMSGNNLNLTNSSLAAGSYRVCIQASETGVATKYQQVAITVNGGGGGTPPVPSIAQAVGYNTLLMNIDLTGQTTDGTHSATYYQTLSNWFTCTGSGGWTATSQLFQTILGAAGVYQPPCSDFNVVTDGSLKALDFTWTAADYNNQNQNDGNNRFAGVDVSTCDNSSTNCSISMPVANYVEFVGRMSPASLSAYSGLNNGDQYLTFDVWGWPINNDFSASSEVDFIEMTNQDNGGSDGINFGGLSWGSIDQTQYHTYGYLLTSDGSSDIDICAFLDGSLVTCNDVGNIGIYSGKNSVILSVGTGGLYYNDTNGNQQLFGPPADTFDFYLQSIRFWSCSSWATGTCHGSTKYNNGGLIYWY